LSSNSNEPWRISSNATSAGAPTTSVPSPLNAGSVFAALTVAHAITRSSGIPTTRNFDNTFAKLNTCSVLAAWPQSVDTVSGNTRSCIACSTMAHVK
jgi:hypothetical protein